MKCFVKEVRYSTYLMYTFHLFLQEILIAHYVPSPGTDTEYKGHKMTSQPSGVYNEVCS